MPPLQGSTNALSTDLYLELVAEVELERLEYEKDGQTHDVDMRLPGVHVGTADQQRWKLLTDVRAYFPKPALAEKLPAHAAVA